MHRNLAMRKLLLEPGRQQVLARRRARAEAQTRVAPLGELADRLPCIDHFAEDFFGVMQQLLACRRERNPFAHSVQKPTADVAFERAHRVADGGLRNEQFLARLREGTRAGKRGKGP
jgi:hypothetical protein